MAVEDTEEGMQRANRRSDSVDPEVRVVHDPVLTFSAATNTELSADRERGH